MNSINRFVDNIYCINLGKRVDRWQHCLNEFEKINIKDKVIRFPAFEMTPGIAGCTRSHYEVFKIAKSKNEKNILVLEDDIVIQSEIFYEILNKTFNQLSSKNVSCNLLYLGANLRGTNNKLIDKNLAKIYSAKTSHAYIINSDGYNRMMDYYEEINWTDRNLWMHNNPNRMNIDVKFMDIQTSENAYGTYPALIDQRSEYSDIQKSFMSYNLSERYNKILENSII